MKLNRLLPMGVLLAISCLASRADAADWRFLKLVGSDDSRSLVYVDESTFKKSGDKLRYWLQFVFETPRPGNFDSAIMLQEATCEEKSFRDLSATYYYQGKSTDSSGETKVRYAVPDSNQMSVLEKLCSNDWSKLNSQDPYAEAKKLLARLRELKKGAQ